MIRAPYITKLFAEEIYKHYWIQIKGTKFLSLKYNKIIHTTHIKKEKSGGLPDIFTKINKIFETERTHFNTASGGNIEMVNMHVYDLYSYNITKNDLPLLELFVVSQSLRLPPG